MKNALFSLRYSLAVATKGSRSKYVVIENSREATKWLSAHCLHYTFRTSTKKLTGTVWTTARTQNWNKLFTQIVSEWLTERIWWTKSQSLLLKIYFRVSRFQSLLLLIHFRYDPNTCSHYTTVWHRTYPICGVPLSRLTWCGELNPNPYYRIFTSV